MRHHTNDLSFERPEWLIDRTHHMFAIATQGASPFNIVVSRTPIEDETLAEMADRIVRDLGATLDAFAVGPRQSATIADRPAIIIQFDWTQNGQRLYQRQALLVNEGPTGRALHQVAATANGDARQRHIVAFSDLITTLRFRGTEGDGRTD